MTLKISEKANPNYLAKVVKLKNLRKHSNADRLQVTTIDGNNVITGLEAKEGDFYVYFPLECSINNDFLAYTNSFQESSLNEDKEAKGFFNSKGRVRAINLRSEKSSGYIVPAHSINKWLLERKNNFIIADEHDDIEFDTIGDVLICEKYINLEALQKLARAKAPKGQKKLARESKLVEGQFAFHVDTMHLAKYAYKIDPDDVIHISKKLHGTSAIAGKILCNRRLTTKDKVAKLLGAKVQETEYQLIWSSRKVVKNGNYYLSWYETFGRNIVYWAKNPGHFVSDVLNAIKKPKATYKNIQDWIKFIQAAPSPNHFYAYDLWRDIALSLEDFLSDGLTFYCEAVGYTKDGGWIQKEYDYGCKPGEFATYIYRITFTSPSGRVFEFSSQQVNDFCKKYGLNVVPELYWGKAKDLFVIPTDQHWHENFVQKMSDTYLEKDCDMCVNKVPDEGIVLRREVIDIEPYKFKSFAFKMRETAEADKGEIDMETIESEQEADS
jgi:hypothetical protein